MTDVKRCDECGKVASGSEWWRLSGGPAVLVGNQIILGGSNGDFCSAECLAKWAAKQ